MPAVRQVSRSRLLPADRGRAWTVLTEPGHLAGWLGAGDAKVDAAPHLATPGSRGRLTEADGTTREVVVTEVEPQRRVVLHWRGDRGQATEPSRVEVTLEDAAGGGTRVTVTEIPLADVLLVDGADTDGPEQGERVRVVS
jgi:uncharacterized protein YndB with AHSA1/START domain